MCLNLTEKILVQIHQHVLELNRTDFGIVILRDRVRDGIFVNSCQHKAEPAQGGAYTKEIFI